MGKERRGRRVCEKRNNTMREDERIYERKTDVKEEVTEGRVKKTRNRRVERRGKEITRRTK